MRLGSARLAAAAASPLLLWIIPLGATLIATPVIVRELGPVEYGAYSLAAAIAAFAVLPSGYAAVARFTAGNSAANTMPAGLLKRIASIQLVAVALNIAVIVLVDAFFDLQMPIQSFAEHAGWIACIAVMLLGTAMSQLFLGALQHAGRWPSAAAILMVSGVALPLTGFALARAGAGWLQILGAQGSILVCAAVLLATTHRRAGRGIAQQSDPVNLTNVAGYMAQAGIAGMIGALMAIGERLVISAVYGPAEAGYFALAMALAMLIHAMMNAANLRLPALLSSRMALSGSMGIERLYRKAMRLTFAATMLALLLASTVGGEFLKLWLGEAPGAAAAPLLPWLSLGMAGLAIAVPPWILADVLGRQRLNILLMLAMAGTWLVAALLAGWFATGPLAIAMARAAAALCLIPYIAAVERAAFGRASASCWARLFAASAAAITAAAAALGVLQWLGAASIVPSSIAAMSAFFAVAHLTGLVSVKDLHPDRTDPAR